MAGLRKRGDRWYAIVDYPRHPDGRRNQKEIALGIITKREAEKRRAQIIADIAAGTAVEPARITFGEYLLDGWLPAQKQRVAAKTYERWEEIARKRLIPRLGNIPLKSLSEGDLLRAYREWAERGKAGSPLSPRTVLHIHRVIFHALKRAVKLRMIPRNVAEHLGDELPRMERREMTSLDERQAVALEMAARGTRLEAAIIFAIDSGCRRGELLAIRWSDVDLDERRLLIRRSLEKTRQHGLRFKETKTGKARTVTLTEETVFALRRHKAKQNETRLLLGAAYQDQDLVFSERDGSPWDPHRFGEHYSRLRSKVSGLPHVRLHDLRHTSATLLLRQGVPTKVVSERLGHSGTAITSDTYQHVIEGMDEDASDRLGRALDKARQTCQAERSA